MRLIIILMVAGMAFGQQGTTASQQSAELARLRAQLSSLKTDETSTLAKLTELLKRYTETYPEVATVKQRLNQIRAQEQDLITSLAVPGNLFQKPSTRNGLQTGLPNKWWRNPVSAQLLSLTADQQKRMDDIFQSYRLKLIDLNGALEKEEIVLEPMVEAEPLDESKIVAQIDRVAQARAELEKANGRMLLGIRKVLTPQQWSKLLH